MFYSYIFYFNWEQALIFVKCIFRIYGNDYIIFLLRCINIQFRLMEPIILNHPCIAEINLLNTQVMYIEFCVLYGFIIDNIDSVFISIIGHSFVKFLSDIGTNVIFTSQKILERFSLMYWNSLNSIEPIWLFKGLVDFPCKII